MLFLLPFRERSTCIWVCLCGDLLRETLGVTILVRPTFLIQDVLLDTKESNQLRQEVILSEEAFGLMGIEGLKVFLSDVCLFLSLLDIVLFKHRELDEVGVGDVVKDCITEYLKLLVADRK